MTHLAYCDKLAELGAALPMRLVLVLLALLAFSAAPPSARAEPVSAECGMSVEAPVDPAQPDDTECCEDMCVAPCLAAVALDVSVELPATRATGLQWLPLHGEPRSVNPAATDPPPRPQAIVTVQA